MPHTTTGLARVLLSCLCLFAAHAMAQQPVPPNGDFEGDRSDSPPTAWFLPRPSVVGGYTLVASDANAANGAVCAKLAGPMQAGPFGTCMQSLDAAPYRGKRVRYSAAVRCDPAVPDTSAQLWLRVDRPNGAMGSFDNMRERPIRSADWQRFTIVADVASDAEAIAFGLLLMHGGTAYCDDVRLEVVGADVAATTDKPAEGEPGLVVVRYAAKATTSSKAAQSSTLCMPLPLAYRDQTPLTFRLHLEPADVDARIAIVAGDGPNRVLELELRDVAPKTELTLRYESVVLVAPSSFEAAPKTAAFPAQWPTEAAPWLASTWCCDTGDERIAALGTELRNDGGDVLGVVDAVLRRSREIFRAAEGRVKSLTAIEALDKQGSCTSCANLVAALLRAAGVPARVLAGYPLWSGALQTHYIVEAFVPGFGWYPVESTRGIARWPNCQQVNVSIVPTEHESKRLAGFRLGVAPGVPFLSVNESRGPRPILFAGTFERFCDHEAQMLRGIAAEPAEWQAAQAWGRERWDGWLAVRPELRAGKLEFGPASDDVAAATLAAVRAALTRQ